MEFAPDVAVPTTGDGQLCCVGAAEGRWGARFHREFPMEAAQGRGPPSGLGAGRFLVRRFVSNGTQLSTGEGGAHDHERMDRVWSPRVAAKGWGGLAAGAAILWWDVGEHLGDMLTATRPGDLLAGGADSGAAHGEGSFYSGTIDNIPLGVFPLLLNVIAQDIGMLQAPQPRWHGPSVPPASRAA